MFELLPSQDSEFAPLVDNLIYLITYISLFFTVAVVGAMIYFAIKYRRKNGVDHPTPDIEGSTFLEIVWTAVPLIICVYVAGYGYYGYREMRSVPRDALEIMVTGKKWNWYFTYPNGKQTVDEFAVPVNKPIKLILTSDDVLHSFFIPGMRTKMDAVPGSYSYQWFKPIRTGLQQVYCTEYCGDNHSGMLAKMNVLSSSDYARWLNEKEKEGKTPADKGAKLYQNQGCVGCHSLDGSRKVGPSFLNLYGRKEELADGTQITADENYIRESILYPNNKIIKGYQPQIMPGFEGKLKDEDVNNLLAFIKSVSGKEVNSASKPMAAPSSATVDPDKMTPEQRGEWVYQGKGAAVVPCQGCHSIDGSKIVGPTWKGLYGKNGKFTDGSDYIADDSYIKESILEPAKHLVEGYPNGGMPPYQGQLDDKDIAGIVAYIKKLK
jgi:cytochrome c oxidase subunit II